MGSGLVVRSNITVTGFVVGATPYHRQTGDRGRQEESRDKTGSVPSDLFPLIKSYS